MKNLFLNSIMKKFYAIIKKYSPLDKEDFKLIFFGLFVNSLSNYTSYNTFANTITLIAVFMALVFLKNRKE